MTNDYWGDDRWRLSGEQALAAFGRTTAGCHQRPLETVVPTVVGHHWANSHRPNDRQRPSGQPLPTTTSGHPQLLGQQPLAIINDRR